MFEQTAEFPVVWDALKFMSRHVTVLTLGVKSSYTIWLEMVEAPSVQNVSFDVHPTSIRCTYVNRSLFSMISYVLNSKVSKQPTNIHGTTSGRCLNLVRFQSMAKQRSRQTLEENTLCLLSLSETDLAQPQIVNGPQRKCVKLKHAFGIAELHLVLDLSIWDTSKRWSLSRWSSRRSIVFEIDSSLLPQPKNYLIDSPVRGKHSLISIGKNVTCATTINLCIVYTLAALKSILTHTTCQVWSLLYLLE